MVVVQLLPHRTEAGRHRVEYRRVSVEHGFLRDQREAQFGLAPQLAVVNRNFAGNNLEQARFAGAIAADKADALAGLDHKIGMVEQRNVAERETDTVKGY